MSEETIMLEWKGLLRELKSAPIQDQDVIWERIKEHEEYMLNKGFKITLNSISSPQGDIIWQRS